MPHIMIQVLAVHKQSHPQQEAAPDRRGHGQPRGETARAAAREFPPHDPASGGTIRGNAQPEAARILTEGTE